MADVLKKVVVEKAEGLAGLQASLNKGVVQSWQPVGGALFVVVREASAEEMAAEAAAVKAAAEAEKAEKAAAEKAEKDAAKAAKDEAAEAEPDEKKGNGRRRAEA